MWRIFRKSDGSQHDIGGGKDSGFEPPKNLPDLAGDIYENGRQRPQTDSLMDNSSALPVNTVSVKQPAAEPQASYTLPARPVVEPSKDSVPKLDMSLVKQQSRSEDTLISRPDVQSLLQSSQQKVIKSNDAPQESYRVQQPVQDVQQYQRYVPSSVSYDASSLSKNNSVVLDNSVILDNFTGFFKEFENHIRDNGLNNEVVDSLLDKNLLDHMVFYHTAKGGDMPFYASSAELSHAIKLKLESLQSVEHAWSLNKQKMDLLKKLGINMETDIHMLSEELKRLVLESRKRGGVVKSNDFFQIMKPRNDSKEARNVVSETSNFSILNQQAPLQEPQQGLHDKDLRDHLDKVDHPTTNPHQYNGLVYKYPVQNYKVVDPSKYFYASNGQVFRSLADLIDGLEMMDKLTFEHHVNHYKNDFSNWIKGVFGDVRLADAIRPLVEREHLWYFFKNNTR